MKRVLAPYRGWPDPEEGTRWFKWIDAIEKDEAVKATTSGDDLYVDSYERFAGEFYRLFQGKMRWLIFGGRESTGYKRTCKSG